MDARSPGPPPPRREASRTHPWGPAPRTSAPGGTPLPRPLPRPALFFLLAAALAVRLHELGTPSMWWDEVLTAMMAQKSLGYIWAWSGSLEVHPPFYYLLVKAFSLGSTSDFALRLSSALCGTAHVGLCALVLNRWFRSSEAALAGAALLAASPLHILLSRQVRPYPELLLLATASLHMTRLWLERPAGRLLAGLAAVNACLASLHFSGLPVLAAQGACTAAWAMARPRERLGRAALSTGLLALSMAPGLFFCSLTLAGRTDMALAAAPADVAGRVALCLAWLFQSFAQEVPVDWIADAISPGQAVTAGLVAGLACLPGYLLCRRADRPMADLLAVTLVLPLALLVAGGQGFMRSRHLMLFLFPSLLFAGATLGRLVRALPPRLAPACLMALALVPLASAARSHNALYRADSYPDRYKSEARALAGMLAPGEPVFLSQYSLFNALQWYLGDGRPSPLLADPAVSPGDPVARVRYVIGSRLDTASPLERAFLGRFGEPSSRAMAHDLPVLTFEWPRRPVHGPGPGPWHVDIAPDPRGLAALSHSMRGLTCFTDAPGKAVAARNHEPAWVRYRFEGFDAPSVFRAGVAYENEGEGSRVALVLDNGRDAPSAALATGPDNGRELLAFAEAGPETEGVSLGVELATAARTPGYPGGNLTTNSFSMVTAASLPLPRDGQPAGSALTARFTGLGHEERHAGTHYRWLEGPLARVRFTSRGGPMDVTLLLNPGLPGLTLDIRLDGRSLARVDLGRPLERLVRWREISLRLETLPGENVLELATDGWNHRSPGETFAPLDPRRLSVMVGRLDLGTSPLVLPATARPAGLEGTPAR